MPTPAPLDGPFRAALERMLPGDPFGQNAAYYNYTHNRDILAPGVLKILDAAVQESLRVMSA